MTLAIAARVARQLRHDPRTLALVTFVPSILAWLVHQVFDGEEPISSQVEMTLLAMFPLLLMFLLTAVATVRERSGGTLERLMAAPIRKMDVIGGYALAYGVLAVGQSSLLTAVCYWGLDMQLKGGIAWMLLVSLATALLGIALGLLASAVSRSEFQAVQFMPIVVLPQVLLCGLFGPREDMAGWLEGLSNVMPLTWAVEALQEVAEFPNLTSHYWTSLAIVAAFAAAALSLASLTLRRRTE
ncbi:MAG: ABC transporter permease [Peptidiphaga gingivicola]